jgi:hypothetical protein
MNHIFLTIVTVAISSMFLSQANADEFGNRFGQNAPYTLGDNLNQGIADTQGIDMNDLNDIVPAAGADKNQNVDQAPTQEVDTKADQSVDDHRVEHTKPEPKESAAPISAQ